MADYKYYALNFKGSVIQNAEDFNSAVVEAKAYVDSLIGDRSNLIYQQAQEAYENAICAAAEEIHKQKTVDEGKNLIGESVGNHSKSYSNTAKTSEERSKAKYDRARMYLANTGLLYRGIG